MEMQQMLERLLANTDEDQGDRKAERKAGREVLKEVREEFKSGQAEMRYTISAVEVKMEAAVHSLRAWRKETMACQGTTEARLECKEPTSEDMEAEHKKVAKKQAAVKHV
jgi:hypothetical protein